MIRIRCSYILLWLVKDNQTSTSLIQNTMEYFVQDHLRQPKRTRLRQNTLTHWMNETYLSSTACRPWPTCWATYSTSTTEYGSTIRRRFCSSRVSYRAERWVRIVESDESSKCHRWDLLSDPTTSRKSNTNLSDNPSTLFRNLRGCGFDVPLQ